MTTEEQAQQHRVAEAAKAAWIAGFQAARHYPSHPIPVLAVEWEGGTPRVVPTWSQQMRGWIS